MVYTQNIICNILYNKFKFHNRLRDVVILNALSYENYAKYHIPNTNGLPAPVAKKMTKPEKENCFADGKYKTFKGKSKCVQRTKKLSKDRANAYTASVLRDMGELPKKKK